MSQARILVLLAVFAAASIFLVMTDESGNSASERGERPAVISVHETDPIMNAAMERARSTVDRFIGRLPQLQAAGAPVSVKFALTENGRTEHVWIANPEFDGRVFAGHLNSVPVNLPSWSQGDRVSVPADRISDWMAISGQTLYGGFTLHVTHERMSPDQRRVLESHLGLPMPSEPQVWN